MALVRSLNVKIPNVALSINHFIDDEIYILNGKISDFGYFMAHAKSKVLSKSEANKEINRVRRNKKININVFLVKNTRLIVFRSGGKIPPQIIILLFNPRLPS